MTARKSRATTAVPVDGAQIRRIRIDRGIEVSDLARRIGISRAYLTNLELGHKPRASATVHAALVRALRPAQSDALRSDRQVAA